MDKETQIRERVRELRSYYTNLIVYGGVSVACIFIWAVTGFGYFWPIWPLMGFGMAAALQGIRLGQLRSLEEVFPFLSPEWEERQVKALLKEGKNEKKSIEIRKIKDEIESE
jgi:hypothetical protein